MTLTLILINDTQINRGHLRAWNDTVYIGLTNRGSTGVQEPEKRYGVKNLFDIVPKSIKMEGFVYGRFADQYLAQYEQEMTGYLKEGKVKYKEHVTHGIEQFPAALVGLTSGHNVGKSVIQV